MTRVKVCLVLLVGFAALVGVGGPSPAAGAVPGTRSVEVTISGGYATDPRDHGRPVVLVAAALGVPANVFRRAFSGVSPAPAGSEPDPAHVKRNKATLLAALGPYGVTNELLDAVSNFYRFNGSAGETWPRAPATANAVVRNGRIQSFIINFGGSGYTSTPVVTVPGFASAKIRATLGYGRDVASNGTLVSLSIVGR